MFPTKLIDLQMSPSTCLSTEYEGALTQIDQNSRDWFFLTEQRITPFVEQKKCYTRSEPQQDMRQQMLEEVNLEGDSLMDECNKIIDNPITSFETNKTSFKKLTTPKIFEEIALTNSMSKKENQQRCEGRLKFFDDQKNYGFIIMDEDGSDIFVHSDDLAKTGLNKEFLKTAKYGNVIRFSFIPMHYFGKYNQSRKAIDLNYLQSYQGQQFGLMQIPAPIVF